MSARPARILLSLGLGIGLVLACGGSDADAPEDFAAAVKERVAAYEALYADVGVLLDGRRGVLAERLEALVPDSERTVADHFVLGNLLYRLDPARSYTHHALAFAAAPEEPAVILEMAYQHQRRGDCHQAGRLYAKLANIGQLSPERYALWAHCQVAVGQYAEALRSWHTAHQDENHAGIDAVIHQVFGDLAPLARHDQLMLRVAARDEAAVDELLRNALEWREDWWNTTRNMDAFRAAVASVEASFGAESEITRETRLFADGLEQQETEAFASLLRDAGLLLDGGRLPRSSYLAREWMNRLLKEKLVGVEQLSVFLPELTERASGGKDVEALDMGIALLKGTGRQGELEPLDRLGWETYREPRFALGLLTRRTTRKGSVAHDDPLLQKALRDFPETPHLARVALVLATRAGEDTPEDVARLIDAEYRSLSSDPKRTSSPLDSYYAELAKRLATETAATAATADD